MRFLTTMLAHNMLFVVSNLIAVLLIVHMGYVDSFALRHHTLQPYYTALPSPRFFMSAVSLSDKISAAVNRKFRGIADVSRVITCWNNFSKGDKVHRYLDEKDGSQEILQEAECFVEGLKAEPFHKIEEYPWAMELANRHKDILAELRKYNEDREKEVVEAEWLGPRDATGGAYGPQWKTLGLQDRGVWEDSRVAEFPFTASLIQKLNVPSCEVFFARQGPRSGISPHSDKNNFIITCHVGLDVPEGDCWIQVGKDKYFWKNGEAVVFDTSVIHSTMNDADKDRNVLLIRFWHPDLTPAERDAFSFIFDYLDHAAYGDEVLQEFETKHLFMGTDKPAAASSTHKAPSAPASIPTPEELSLKSSRRKANRKNTPDAKKGSSTGTSSPVSKGFGKK